MTPTGGRSCATSDLVLNTAITTHVVDFAATMSTLSARSLIALPWLLRVRWVMVAGQAVVVAIAVLILGITLPVPALLSLIAASAVTNAVAWAVQQRVAAASLGGTLLLLDVLQLTGLMWLTGGPLNPFSMLFLVYITLAAVVLGSRWTWTIAVAAGLGFGVLFVAPVDAHSAVAHAFAGEIGGHLQGMWWAFAVSAALTAAFVVRLSREIDDRDRELASARERAARTERLASLTTLAAGAAHELSTPLATIAVAAGELQRSSTILSAPETLEDVQLIQQQVARARTILDRLGRRAGDPPGEMPHTQPLATVITTALALIPDADRSRVTTNIPLALNIKAPTASLSESVAGLIRNALDAGATTVEVTGTGDARWCTLTIRDNGTGIPAEVLERVGEPFFTTKGPGHGLGLGVFLARLMATELDGAFDITSTPGTGTIVILRLPSAR